ncbi:beta-N-acetylhexosaminidase [Carboxylicivirga sp. N1Y90]|uniref:beta-N-acetylhexosaminidase n=1 Tax=Carboxylicivirga fragile TaxID=3417571 RepID=UPI003D339C50|nr:beta-N-acetylhexosaminidase [Marinilabiliaceae bacterium N1Y90]
MKNLITLYFTLLLLSSCQTKEIESWNLIPYPNSISYCAGNFSFKNGITFLSSDSCLNQTVFLFKERFKDFDIVTDDKSIETIELMLVDSCKIKSEAYELVVNKKRITLTASDAHGIFYGLMTIWQELKFSNRKTIPCGTIKDEPRFEYRGYMLDESRHFFGKEKVKKIIDIMAMFKLNKFHWHLTDEHGWRIEIESLPKLTTIGGIGDYTNQRGKAKYYTQDEIREVVKYAKERFIEIIPEIDMPGHASAANRAYPEYSGGGSDKHPDFTFDVGKETTYTYLNTILEEVAQLFPSKHIHLGGDEVHYGNNKWKMNDSIQLLMKREKLKTPLDVEHYFMRRMANYLFEINKGIAGWDEIVDSGIGNETALVYWWRHDKVEQLQKALDKEFQIVLCPRLPLYFDFVQYEKDSVGRRWGDIFGTINDVYNYPDDVHEFSEKEIVLIEGLQGNLWTETVKSSRRFDYMTFPRIIALSESAWTKKKNKDISRFHENLPMVFKFLNEESIYYFNNLNPREHKEPIY